MIVNIFDKMLDVGGSIYYDLGTNHSPWNLWNGGIVDCIIQVRCNIECISLIPSIVQFVDISF